jgi:CheY-like chemotaxis protein
MTKGKTILVIDDEQNIRDSLADLLSVSGYRVLQSDGGEKGISLAITHKPDLIMCDIMMPQMDGYDTLRKLRSENSTRDIPVIFVTAKAEKQAFEKGMSMGATDFLLKPFTFKDVQQVIDRCLG